MVSFVRLFQVQDVFAEPITPGMDKIVLLYDNDGIVALCALQFFDLQNLAHLECSQILRCGQDWVSDKIKNGARSICYGSKLVSDRNHSVHRIHKFRSLGSLYAVLMFRHFQETGLDLAVCVTRRDRGMTSAATLVGGHQEREVEIEGVEYLDLDLMVANQQDAAAFPFQRMGPAFDSLWQGRRSTWEEVVADGLVIKVHEL